VTNLSYISQQRTNDNQGRMKCLERKRTTEGKKEAGPIENQQDRRTRTKAKKNFHIANQTA